ncbi:hypothetical protein [Paenibacillus popilliae]|uniref:Methyltransferase n=1 Tax=Paenibacillus popilliae ATCC 14706 TaxID=1212764 RepID=M9M369_PAEPP|nr:hypothetical protein [Paenibacillus popilliae]GAC41623.1 methyltransferase [Paenibacillus popilliae ATCC 14706]
MSTLPSPDSRSTQRSVSTRMARIMDTQHPLCREDIVWVLNFVKSKLTEQDEAWVRLGPERILQNFRYFSEISLLLIHGVSFSEKSEHIRQDLAEATYGLLDQQGNP